jgi:hypothetical protein
MNDITNVVHGADLWGSLPTTHVVGYYLPCLTALVDGRCNQNWAEMCLFSDNFGRANTQASLFLAI